MFGNTFGASVGSRASAIELNFRRRSPSEIALIALRAVFVGLTVALFFAWLTSANMRGRAGPGLTADADCVSLGRGGARCASRSAGDGAGAADLRSDCVSAGRGGLVCASAAK